MFAIVRMIFTFSVLIITTVVITELYKNSIDYSIYIGLPAGFTLAIITYIYLTIRKQPKSKIRTLQLTAMVSFLLCLAVLFIYHWFTKQTSQLDIPSHFLGGITTSALVSLIYETVPGFSFLEGRFFQILVMVVIGFEFFEYLFLYYIMPDLEYVPTVTQPFDTITDIMAGLIGGSIFIIWEARKWKQKKV